MIESKRYDDETLKHLQKIQKMMLKDFDKICEENNITYFVNGGTLLGTIRHKGFIPWDDDIDVMMFQKDFEKLNKLMQSRKDNKYGVINVLNEENYPFTWPRFILKGTAYIDWYGDQLNFTQDIYIDIFVIYNLPNNKIKQFIYKWHCFALNQMTIYSYIKYQNDSKLKEKIQQIAYYLLKIIPISPYSIKKKCMKTYKKYENYDSDEVCDFPAPILLPIYKKNYWLPPKKAMFEDIEVNIPNNPDTILKIIYGDYMKLPPEDQRFRPAPERLDFGDY